MKLNLRTKGPLCLAAALAVGLVCAGDAQAQKRVTVTSLYGPDKPQTLVWKRFEEVVEEKMPGAFQFNIVTDGALGGEKEEAEGALLGSIAGSLSTIANLTTWVPEGALFDMPFIFRSPEHIEVVMAGEIGQDMKSLYKEQGFTVLDFIIYGSRNVISPDVIKGPDDVKGKTMRVLQSDLHIQLWSSLGANPTPVPITEAYGALETGVVDYMDMTKSGFEALKLYEVAPNLTETNHIWALGVLYFGNTFFDSLSAEEQAVFEEAAAEASDYFTQLAADEQESSLARAKELGASAVETDADSWRAAMEPFWQEYAENVGGMERIRTVVDTKE